MTYSDNCIFLFLLISVAAAVASYALFSKIKKTIFYGKLRFLFVEILQVALTLQWHQFRNGGKNWSFVDFFEEKVDKNPDVVQFITAEENRAVTLGGMERLANQLAYWAKGMGLKEHDSVAVMMLNRPEMVTFWLGMAKIGVSSALINSNISGKAFMHSVNLSLKDTEVKILLVDSDLQKSLESELDQLRCDGVRVVFWDELEKTSSTYPTDRVSRSERRHIRERDPLIYIFTSGTTGLPKACKLSSSKFLLNSMPVGVFLGMKPGDRFYNCLPLYHSAGGMLVTGGCIRSGATMVLRRKFSVRNFTPDCIRYRCVAMQYIGELCRYLANAPPNPDDINVGLKFAIGNGMRPDVWEKFQKRYGVDRIIEFYGATEGNVACFNSIGKVGAIGYMPYFMDKVKSMKLLRVDPECKEKPLRGEDGRCLLAKYNEVGLLVSKIDPRNVSTRFDGYTDSSSTEKKILCDVFEPGDRYYNSGDLMSRDEEGFFYWSDRVGDTFRWKGENVATTEVENVLHAVPGIAEVTVYGVAVPNYDGRVGMAAMILEEGKTAENMDWSAYHKECTKNLASYSRPAFLRVQEAISVTATFKHQKSILVKDGFDPDVIKKDKLFFYSQKDGSITPLDSELFRKVATGEVKI